MPRLKIIIATFALLILTLACRAATDILPPDNYDYEDKTGYSEPGTTDTEVEPAPTSVTTEGQTCPILLSDIMAAATEGGGDAEAQDEQYLVTYTVNKDEISDPQYETVPSDLRDEQDDTVSQE
jgi:hypothetical protein